MRPTMHPQCQNRFTQIVLSGHTIATETKNQPRKITDLLESLRQTKKGASNPALERMSMIQQIIRFVAFVIYCG